ncbi:DUF2093 domain-containing protein [Pseudochrobactrum algeriensis]|uniref:DUF2093 domain-containing protein n=1 Tax=Pseudochrobactrum saccharolyticum TaxID=354352 RepID=A0A7W8AFX2_9HYPH|nr:MULTISPECIES: DUF2093 domain-containing protein [Pseudochrobactrum]MBX8811993.1 DUF2093 domain-containing protein [Ochrobactrum sp. MR34]KAB0540203.1 DUF2093 domain-containing protein [Pseudochrobactrum saccharolyticum]MBB5089706.1 hypothetical protein [Pseudochrobactrum saccharolyticum]MDP8251614.1 DUF2093 domain-containing protein [Pseudochrobactrum saccharolyticum]QVQ37451.1 DUF2093 domain-containing protein [Pseudochrobactrum algeriensis]
MNMFSSNRNGEAKLRYLDGDYQVLEPGSYVICAVTGEKIELDDLRYWSVARQEAYVNGLVSYQRELEANPELRQRSKS